MILLVPAARARRTTRVLGSRFEACVEPVADEAAAAMALRSVELLSPDATHHCWALRLRAPAGSIERSDDAGEPAGTAGPPILQALRTAGLEQTLLVVARWFGGTKLGKGGLARAYREAAKGAIEAAGVLEARPLRTVRLEGPADRDGEVRHLISRHGGRVIDASYGEGPTALLRVETPEAAVERLAVDLAGLTHGAWSARPSEGYSGWQAQRRRARR